MDLNYHKPIFSTHKRLNDDIFHMFFKPAVKNISINLFRNIFIVSCSRTRILKGEFTEYLSFQMWCSQCSQCSPKNTLNIKR